MICVGIAAAIDIRERRIPNWLSLSGVLGGISLNSLTGGVDGLLLGLLGVVTGFFLLFFAYLLGGMGAGDVKLMAAIGALTGPVFVLESFIYIALIGGAIGLILIMKKRGIWKSIKAFLFTITYMRSEIGTIVIKEDKQSSTSFPYGAAIVAGTICAFGFGGI